MRRTLNILANRAAQYSFPPNGPFFMPQEVEKIPAIILCSHEFRESVPHVTVIMVTYNHSQFIGQAIESVLKQVTRFKYEILVGDDCSTDDTLDICEKYRKDFPDRICIVSADKNVGVFRNWARLWCRARGVYIADCDGDDYWHSSDKLEKQTSFMEENKSCSISFHDCDSVTHETGESRAYFQAPVPQFYPLSAMLKTSLPHCTVFYRRDILPFLPCWMEGLYPGDWLLFILFSLQGYVCHIDGLKSIHRRHDSSTWTPVPSIEKMNRQYELYTVVRKKVPIPLICDREFREWLAYSTLARYSTEMPAIEIIRWWMRGVVAGPIVWRKSAFDGLKASFRGLRAAAWRVFEKYAPDLLAGYRRIKHPHNH